MGAGDDIRAAQRAMWDKFSAGWEKWDPVVLATNGPVGDEIIRSLGITDDQQHLDVAAGTGEPGLTIATLAPRGRVVVTDISAGMLAAAQRRAEAKTTTTSNSDNAALMTCRSMMLVSTL